MESKQSFRGVGFSLFFFGILVGVIIALFITTKRGRELLETIIDEGIEKIEDWNGLLAIVEESQKKKLENVEGEKENFPEKDLKLQKNIEKIDEDLDTEKETLRHSEKKKSLLSMREPYLREKDRRRNTDSVDNNPPKEVTIQKKGEEARLEESKEKIEIKDSKRRFFRGIGRKK